MKDGIVVFGFAGIGKSTLCKNTNNKKFLDLESSNFQWILNDEQKLLPVEQRKGLIFQKNPDWPDNYAKAIIDVRNKYDFIFVAHEGKIQCQKYNIPYILVFPNYDLKDEYIKRMKNRGNSEEFIKKLSNNFDKYVKECFDDNVAKQKIILKSGEYLSDIIYKINI